MIDSRADFRDEAVAASRSMIDVGPEVDLLPLGLSLCLPMPDQSEQSLRQIKFIGITSLVLGFIGIIVGGVLAYMHNKPILTDRGLKDLALFVGFSCSVLGIATLFMGVFICRFWVHRQVADRYRRQFNLTTAKVKLVEVENAATFHKKKLVSEDMGTLSFDSTARAILIEGVRFRYAIFADDVLTLIVIRGEDLLATRIDYQIGETILGIVVYQSDNLIQEFRRQTIGVKQPTLYKDIAKTLRHPARVA